MPNRILKESICTSENVDKLTAFQETFFYRLIVNCDDYGRMDARPKILASALYPLKTAKLTEITRALDALAGAGLVLLYERDGRPYLQMKSWGRHQKIRALRSRYPAPEDEPAPAVRDFVELYGPEGSLGVFRVSGVRRVWGGQRQVSLEHGACTLADGLTGPLTVRGGSLRAMLEAVLSCQRPARWQLGEVEVSADFPETDLSGMSLLEAVLTLVTSAEGATLAFDQSGEPWLLHVRRKPTEVSCECRLNRNLHGATVSTDESGLCTRVTVEDAAGIARDYDGEGIARWGVIHRCLTAAEGENPEAVARRYLREHSQPTVSVELEAEALAELTGEALDSFRLGQVCRVGLPEGGAALEERVIAIHHPDLCGDPARARLTLSAGPADAAAYLSRLSAAATGVNRSLNTALRHIRETETGVTILAEEIELRATKEDLGHFRNEVFIRLDASDASITLHAEHLDRLEDSLSAAGVRIDGLGAQVALWASKAEENGRLLSQARLDIDGAAATITAQAQRLDTVEGSLSQARLDIDGAAATITAQAQLLDAQGNQLSAAEVRMDGLAATIDLKVSKDGLISQINMSSEAVTISASKINLSGYVTMSEFSALKAEVGSMWNGTLEASAIQTMNLVATNTVRLIGHTCEWKKQRVVTSVNSPTFNYVTLQYKDHDGNNKTQVVLTSVHTAASGNTTELQYMGY